MEKNVWGGVCFFVVVVFFFPRSLLGEGGGNTGVLTRGLKSGKNPQKNITT